MAKTEISIKRIFIPLIVLALLLSRRASAADVFARDNLVVWCIVPFDSQKRTPRQRADMLEKLGIHRCAYDWRAEHLPTFETELNELKRHNIELTALWFPAELNADARLLLDGIKKHDLHPQLWVMMQVTPQPDQSKTIASTVPTIRPIAIEAAKLKGQVALYNHAGWFDEPENHSVQRLFRPHRHPQLHRRRRRRPLDGQSRRPGLASRAIEWKKSWPRSQATDLSPLAPANHPRN